MLYYPSWTRTHAHNYYVEVKVHSVAIGNTRVIQREVQRKQSASREASSWLGVGLFGSAAMDKGLDEAFKSTVAEMKPFAKNLPQKSSMCRF